MGGEVENSVLRWAGLVECGRGRVLVKEEAFGLLAALWLLCLPRKYKRWLTQYAISVEPCSLFGNIRAQTVFLQGIYWHTSCLPELTTRLKFLSINESEEIALPKKIFLRTQLEPYNFVESREWWPLSCGPPWWAQCISYGPDELNMVEVPVVRVWFSTKIQGSRLSKPHHRSIRGRGEIRVIHEINDHFLA